MGAKPEAPAATESKPLVEAIENLAPADLHAAAWAKCSGAGWLYGHSSGKGNPSRFWKMDLDGDAAFDAIWEHARAALREPLRLEGFRERLNEYAPAGLSGAGWRDDAAPSRLIAFASRRPRIWRRDPQKVLIRAGGRELLFPADAIPLLQFVIDRAPVPAAGFFEEFSGEFDCSELLDFLSLLSRSGIIE